jgi:uncharacterized protein YkwD
MLRAPSRLATFAVLGALLGGAVPTAPHALLAEPAPAVSRPPVPQAISLAVLELTNAERTRAGLSPLQGNGRLVRAAQLHAEQMVVVRRMDHVLSGVQYPAPADRLRAAGYDWRAYAENVAVGHRGAAEVVLAWMESPGHRANILNAKYTELGFGYAVDGNGRPYYAQVFGRPAS